MIGFSIGFQRWLSTALLSGVLILVCSCIPKIYLSSYSDTDYNPADIKKVAIVLEDLKTHPPPDSHLFAEIFVQSVIERKKFFIVGNEADADALLKIALTHANRGDRTSFLSTSVGAYAKLLDVETGRMLWNVNYAYTSIKTGPTAPVVEKVMKIVALKLIDLIPLQYTVGTLSRYDRQTYIPPGGILTSGGGLQKLNDGLSRKISSLQGELTALKESVRKIDSLIAEKPWQDNPIESSKRKTTRIKEKDATDASQAILYYSLQVGAFQSKQYAEDRKAMLIRKGYAPRLVQISDGTGKVWNVVRIADYIDRNEALKAAAVFSEKERMEIVVLP